MSGGQGFEVTPDELHKVAREVDDVVGRAQRSSAGFTFAQQGRASGFALMGSAARCEAGWQRTVQVQAAKLGVDGDLLGLCAEGYRSADDAIAAAVGGR